MTKDHPYLTFERHHGDAGARRSAVIPTTFPSTRMTDFLGRIAALFTGRASPDPLLEQVAIHRIPVVVRNTRPDIATADVLARLTEELDLIATHQPWRLRHLQRSPSWYPGKTVSGKLGAIHSAFQRCAGQGTLPLQ